MVIPDMFLSGMLCGVSEISHRMLWACALVLCHAYALVPCAQHYERMQRISTAIYEDLGLGSHSALPSAAAPPPTSEVGSRNSRGACGESGMAMVQVSTSA